MKPIRIVQSLALLALAACGSAALAQDAIIVRLAPKSESTIVGKLESISLAVNAEWPQEAKPVPGWRPIYFRGKFKVYLDSHQLGKDYAPLPGSRYLLAPSPNAQTLTIATEEDKAEIVSIDPRYCHINLETIILAYIEDKSATAAPPALPEQPSAAPTRPSPAPANAAPSAPDAQTVQGILVAASSFEKQRAGFPYKIVDSENRVIGLVDASRLPEFVLIKDYLNAQVVGTGTFKKANEASDPIIVLQTLKKKLQ